MTDLDLTHRRTAQLLMVIALLASTAPVAPAQLPDVGGTWNDVEYADAASLPERTNATRRGSLFFYTPLDGERALTPYTRNRDTTYFTSDGGETWRAVANPLSDPPEYPNPRYVPAGTLGDGFAWYRSGTTTLDAGRTYRPPAGPFVDFTVASRTAHAALRRSESGPVRLVVSSDGGGSWTPLDVVTTASGDSMLTGTVYGAFEPPPLMAGTRFEWLWLPAYRGTEVSAILCATGTIDASHAIRYYLVVIDVAARTMRSIPLPMWNDFLTGAIVGARPTAAALSRSRVLVAELEIDWYFLTTRFVRLWSSDDGGASWARHDTVQWIEESALKFFSPTLGVSPTARTTDAGRTWQINGRPFGDVFFALDSAHWFVGDLNMLTARTSDAGRTWRRSSSSAPLRTVAAHRGNVVVGRSQRSVLTSSDGGQTWSDRGRAGELPDDLVQFVATAWMDTADAPGAIVAVAGFVDADGVRSARLVASNDYGRTWTERTRLPFLDLVAFSRTIDDLPLQIVRTSGGEGAPPVLFIAGYFGLAASTDDGATWEMRSRELPVHGLAMISSISGVAASIDGENSTVGFHRTDDGGRTWTLSHSTPEGFVYPVSLGLTELGYRAIVSNFSAGYHEWVALSSFDGFDWSQRRSVHDGPALKGSDAHWSPGDRAHIVGRGASILYSRDGGASLSVHRDVDRRYYHPIGTDSTADSMYRPLSSVFDGRAIYVIDKFRNLGRWTLGEEVLAAPIVSAAGALEARLLFARDGGTAALHVAGARAPRAWLVDMRGARRPLELIADGGRRHRAALDLGTLAPGAYIIAAAGDDRSVSLPFVVGR